MLSDLDTTTWKALDQLLTEALDLTGDQRQAFLDTLPPEAQPLRQRLVRLLDRVDGHTEQRRLDTIPRLGSDDEQAPSRKVGDEVGPYRLLEAIAEGGMGQVWLAERSDGVVKRPVALKLSRQTARPDITERLSRERDILASLTHPNIARLYDAGLTADAQPYLAMELIDGVPINVYADNAELGVRERLALFVDLADAVNHAHQRLVIHRDLKPSNVLVTQQGRVQLLDFGIATLIEQGTTTASDVTRQSGTALTVAYASPEQIRGEPLTVASDVYSLGVMLYELLSGARAHRPKRGSIAALEDAVLHDEPRRPSDAAPRERRRILRGDIDAIVQRAMQKSTDARYATVEALRADVVRFLQGRPVQAREPSRLYRFKKFIARHRTAVAAASIALIGLVGGGMVSAWQAHVATVERDRAAEVTKFIESIFKDADVNTGDGSPLSAVDLLRQARKRIDRKLTRPEIRVELLSLIAQGLLSFHAAEEAEAVARQAAEEATTTRGPDHRSTIIARFMRGWALLFKGRNDDLEDLLNTMEPQLAAQPRRPALDWIQLHRLRAYLAFQRGDYVAAAQRSEAALAVPDFTTDADVDRFVAMIQLAEAYSFLDRHSDAIREVERAKAAGARLYDGSDRHPKMLVARTMHASVLGRAGHLDNSVDELLEVARIRTTLYGEDAYSVGITHNNVVGLMLKAGRVHDALHSSQHALRILSQKSEPDSYAALAANRTRGSALLSARRSNEALEILRKVAPAAERIFGAAHKATRSARLQLAIGMAYAGRTAGDVDLADSAKAEGDRLIVDAGQSDAARGATHSAIGLIHRLAGSNPTAIIHLEKAHALLEPDVRSDTKHAKVSTQLGLALLDAGEFARPGPLLKAAVDRYRQVRTAIAPDHADALIGLGRIRLAEGHADKAIALFTEAVTAWRALDSDGPWAREAGRWLDRAQALKRKRNPR